MGWTGGGASQLFRACSRAYAAMISAPKGVLRLAALRMLSESSLSGSDLADQISRATSGEWTPGPGSIYLILSELLKKGLINELPKREGNTRRYIISAKGKEELSRVSRESQKDVARQLRLLGVYSSLAGREDLRRKLADVAAGLAA